MFLLFTLDIQKVNSSNTDDEALEEKRQGCLWVHIVKPRPMKKRKRETRRRLLRIGIVYTGIFTSPSIDDTTVVTKSPEVSYDQSRDQPAALSFFV